MPEPKPDEENPMPHFEKFPYTIVAHTKCVTLQIKDFKRLPPGIVSRLKEIAYHRIIYMEDRFKSQYLNLKKIKKGLFQQYAQ